MNYTKQITIGGILSAFAVIFQTTPVFFTEFLVFITLLSMLPIYFISRMYPKAGICAYIAAAGIIFMISTHEGLFFICTNGLAGLSLGICKYYKIKRAITVLIASSLLTSALSFISFVVGIPVFGVQMPFNFWIQTGILFCFSLFYNTIFTYVSDILYRFCLIRLKLYKIFINN